MKKTEKNVITVRVFYELMVQLEQQPKEKLPLGVTICRCSLCDAALVGSACCGLFLIREVGCSVSLHFPRGAFNAEGGRKEKTVRHLETICVLTLLQKETVIIASGWLI